MHILDQPDGQRVICAGGQHGEIFLGFYNKRKYIYNILFYPKDVGFQYCICVYRWKRNQIACHPNI